MDTPERMQGYAKRTAGRTGRARPAGETWRGDNEPLLAHFHGDAEVGVRRWAPAHRVLTDRAADAEGASLGDWEMPTARITAELGIGALVDAHAVGLLADETDAGIIGVVAVVEGRDAAAPALALRADDGLGLGRGGRAERLEEGRQGRLPFLRGGQREGEQGTE